MASSCEFFGQSWYSGPSCHADPLLARPGLNLITTNLRVIVTRYGGVWPGAIYWFLVLSVEVFDLFRASSSLAWCCLRSRPLSLLESQFNESRGATPSLIPAQAEPDRVLYHRQLEPHATLLLSSGRVVPDPPPLLYVLFLSIASVLIAPARPPYLSCG